MAFSGLMSVVFIALFSAPSEISHDSFYNYSTQFSSNTMVCENLININNSNHIIYLSQYISFTGDLYFDSVDSYRVDNLVITSEWQVSYFDNHMEYAGLSGTNYGYYSYHTDWQFTKETYDNQIANCYTYSFIDDDCEVSVAFYDSSLDVAKLNDWRYSDISGSCYNRTNLRVNFDDSEFLNSIESFISTQVEGESAYANGYSVGFTDGYNNAMESGSTAATIFAGFVTVGLLPINVFLQILNFEVFGINIGGLVTGFLTIAIIVIIIRLIFGGKKDD